MSALEMLELKAFVGPSLCRMAFASWAHKPARIGQLLASI